MYIDLSITLEEALNRISLMIDQKKFPFIFTHTGDKEYIGRIKDNRFWVYRKISYRNSFNPILRGTIEQINDGCRIQTDFGISITVKIFTIIWISMVLLGCCIGLISVESSSEVSASFIIVPFVMLLIGVFIMYLGTAFGKREGEQIKKALMEQFDGVCLQSRQEIGKFLAPLEAEKQE